jgi:hypothetical protein
MFRVGVFECCGMVSGLNKRLIKFSFRVGGGYFVITTHN